MKNPFKREPDFHVGGKEDPYMLRWWLIPRNKYFNIYLHKFLRDDEDRAEHCHPWPSLSFILKGKYIEHSCGKIKIYPRWSVVPRRSTHIHRIELFKDNVAEKEWIKYGDGNQIRWKKVPRPVWTLFVTGRKVREWGFWCEGTRFVPWYDFVDPNDKGATGPGCGN